MILNISCKLIIIVRIEFNILYYKFYGMRIMERILMKFLNLLLCGYGLENGVMGDILYIW